MGGRRNEMSEDLGLCSICKIGYLKPTGEIVIEGEFAGEFMEIGTRRVFQCENCKQRLVRVAHREYVKIGDDVKTKEKGQV